MRNLILLSAAPGIMLLFACSKENKPANKLPVANAGNYSELYLSDTGHLKGSGTDADGTVVSYLWSQVTGPVSSNLFNPGDSATAVTFTSTGTYLFRLMVVDNDGASGLDTVTMEVKANPIDTLSLQPAKNVRSVMIWGNLNGLDLSWAQSPESGAAAWTYNGAPMYERSALQFDLSPVPQKAKIISAYLNLYSENVPINGNLHDANVGQNAMYIKRITEDWDPATTNFAHQPATTENDQVSIPSTIESRLDISADVKGIVTAMVSSGNNHGFMIQLQNEIYYSSRLFYSSYASDSTKAPKLVVIYQH